MTIWIETFYIQHKNIRKVCFKYYFSSAKLAIDQNAISQNINNFALEVKHFYLQ